MFHKVFNFLIFVSVSLYVLIGQAQVEVITPQRITHYDLDFSDPKPNNSRYKVDVGSAELINQGYDLTLGALYILDRRTKTAELISKTMSGRPAQVKKHRNGYAGTYEASDSFDVIAYISAQNYIVAGDTANNNDVFIYDRISGQTRSVQGRQSHQGDMSGLRVSPTGGHLVFESQDQAFAGALSTVVSSNMLYVYDIVNDDLYPLAFQGAGNNSPEFTTLTTAYSQTDAFTLDGKNLFFGETISGLGDYGSLNTYIFNLQTKQYNDIDNSLFAGSPALTALSNNYYLYTIDALTGSDVLVYSLLGIYDVEKGRSFYLPEGDNTIFAGMSADKRYAAFYAITNNNDALYDQSSGVVSIMDTHSGEFRRAFEVRAAFAMTYVDDYTGRTRHCQSYLINTAFFQTPVSALSCNANPVLSHADYMANSVETYNLDTEDVLFHNNGRYLSFRANSWFVDDRIAYVDYDYEAYSDQVRRQHYVVANPFLHSIVVEGAPSINRTSDMGWYIWRDNGVWKNRFVAGAGKLTLEGQYRSNKVLSELRPISIESNDKLAHSSKTELEFKLNVSSPYQDGFTIKAANSAITCVELKALPGIPIHLGPKRVLMTDSFDLNTGRDCQLDRLASLGRPAIDRNVDRGVFIWRNQNDAWQVEVVSADKPRWVSLNLRSSDVLSNFRRINIESNDVFNVDGTSAAMRLRVRAPWYDGFKFDVVNGAYSCLSSEQTSMPIYLGSMRTLVGQNINLDTLKSCN